MDIKLDELPQVVLTSDMDWDPSVVDNDLDQWPDAQMELDNLPGINDCGDLIFDDQGYYRDVTVKTAIFYDSYQCTSEYCDLEDIVDNIERKYRVNPHEVSQNDPDFEALRPNFAWAPVDVIKRTFDVTTRWARSVELLPFRKHFKSRFPALNVHRRNEPVATDTIYSDMPAVDNGAMSAQICVGTERLVTDVYGMKSDAEFINTRQDNIRKREL